jgi:hypothetical protein
VDSIAKFKAELRKRKDISQVPKHYEIENGIMISLPLRNG